MKLRAAIILERDRGQDAIQHLGLEDEVPEEGKVCGKVRVRRGRGVEEETDYVYKYIPVFICPSDHRC